MLVNGQLPDWLRNKRRLFALDTYNDNLCLFRCIAVHRGTRPDRCTEKAIELGKKFWAGSNDQQVRVLRAVEFIERKRLRRRLNLAFVYTSPGRMVLGGLQGNQLTMKP